MVIVLKERCPQVKVSTITAQASGCEPANKRVSLVILSPREPVNLKPYGGRSSWRYLSRRVPQDEDTNIRRVTL